MRTKTASRSARNFSVGLAVGVAAALAIQQARALTGSPTHTTSRYAIERGAVTTVSTGDPAGETESARWYPSGKMSYDMDGRSVGLAVLPGGFVLHREGP